ncbi:MAG: YbjN domain-containing protein [Actinobacteria bacterium]|nr:YbjN domain-containing protein [Actinomycetota bacterium]
MTARDAARHVVTAGLDAADLPHHQVAPDAWTTVLSGERKRTLPLVLTVDDRSLRVEALLCGRPDENHAGVYRYLLQRNRKHLPVHFALGDDGDVILTGAIPLATLEATSFDQLLGAVLATADEVFDAVLRLGFASYIAAEQRWRAVNDLPPNPVGGG